MLIAHGNTYQRDSNTTSTIGMFYERVMHMMSRWNPTVKKVKKCSKCDFASSRAGHLRAHLKTCDTEN